VQQRIVAILGVLLTVCLSVSADSVHTYGHSFHLRIPAEPPNPEDPNSRGWMADAVIDVPDHLTVLDVDVGINMTHTNVFDLQVFLKSPAGTRILLNMYDCEKDFAEHPNYTDTVFDDEAALSIKQGEPPFPGRFKPRSPSHLSCFDGQDACGKWRLQIYDAWWADTGYLNEFELVITALDPASLSVLNPNGGEVLVAGGTCAIQWSSIGSISNVFIEYSADNGSSWVPVNPPNAGNTGSYNWQVPAVDSSQCLIRVSDASNPSITDTSDTLFTIEYDAVTEPTVTTQSAVDISATTATLRGSIADDGGEDCQYSFRYKLSGGSYTCTSWLGSKTTGQLFSSTISGLSPASLYYFSAQAQNSAGVSDWGDQESFTTNSLPPTVKTRSAGNVGKTSATLTGTIVDDGGDACQYRFWYRKYSGSYFYTSWTGSITVGQAFSQEVTSLNSGTTYYFYAQAKNSAGESNWGSEKYFVTRKIFGGRGSGTERDPYIISDVYELQQINNELDAWYELADDVNAYDTCRWNNGAGFIPIGNNSEKFSGHFDGQGHKIFGLYIDRPSDAYVGLFGYADATAQVENVGVVDVNIIGNYSVGALVGTNKGTVRSCYSTGKATGSSKIGGLVGRNYLGSANIIDSYSTVNVVGDDEVGGLVGQNEGGTINHCYSIGLVTGSGDNVGGLVGSNNGICTDCFWDIENSGQATSACGEGKTTAQMQMLSTFNNVGWDFDNTWVICEYENYPKLIWQLSPADFLCPDGVDLVDLAFLTAHWLHNNCNELNDYCDGADLNWSITVDTGDLEIFCRCWLVDSP